MIDFVLNPVFKNNENKYRVSKMNVEDRSCLATSTFILDIPQYFYWKPDSASEVVLHDTNSITVLLIYLLPCVHIFCCI